jgi:7-cyano-7-deazaguanine synthase
MGTVDGKPLAVVLLSGGMDSLTAAGMARKDGFDLALIHFNYGQRTEEAELRSFARIAEFLGVPGPRRLVVHTNFFTLVGGSALTDRRLGVPGADLGSDRIPVTYVPFRNAVLLSMAVGWAEALGARAVYYGAVSQDSSGYPDCRAEFVAAMQVLVDAGTRPDTNIRLHAPLVNLSKADIVKAASEMDLPLALTWSCYQRNDRACGTCDSCALRLRGFEQAGLADPIEYARLGSPDHEAMRDRIRKLGRLLNALKRKP